MYYLNFVFRCRKWLINCRRMDLDCFMRNESHLHANYRLCSDHFENSQFMNQETKNKLIWNAIPTLFEVPNPPPQIQSRRLCRGMISVSTYNQYDVKICYFYWLLMFIKNEMINKFYTFLDYSVYFFIASEACIDQIYN